MKTKKTQKPGMTRGRRPLSNRAVKNAADKGTESAHKQAAVSADEGSTLNTLINLWPNNFRPS